MQKLSLGIMTALLLLSTTVPSSEAGHRRNSRRALHHTPCCAPPASVASCPSCPIAGQYPQTQAVPSLIGFPDVCAKYPVAQDENGDWVWYAERHYGEGLNCYTCYIEATSLTGDYGFSTFEWPYPCGHERCEPSTLYRTNPNGYSGRKKGAPVDFDYSPLRDIPREAMAQEVGARTYYSFNDRSGRPKTRYFIAYHIKARRHQFTIAHEVDRAILDARSVTIHPLSDADMFPVDPSGQIVETRPYESYVYVHKPAGKSSDMVFLLKR